jgi:hypothetical protein
MVSWFVDKHEVETVLKGKLVEEEEVEVRPESLPDAAIDDNVDIFLIRKYFSSDAWLLVMDAVKTKKSKPIYVCKVCFRDLHDERSIACDHCLSWYHIQCAGLKQEPRSRYWFCRKCHGHIII